MSELTNSDVCRMIIKLCFFAVDKANKKVMTGGSSRQDVVKYDKRVWHPICKFLLKEGYRNLGNFVEVNSIFRMFNIRPSEKGHILIFNNGEKAYRLLFDDLDPNDNFPNIGVSYYDD
jgi:hypothetical protein